MNVTKMYMFLFAIITAVIGSTEQENRLANTCWKVSWNRRNHKGKLIGIEKIDSTGHLSKPSNLLAVVSHNDAWAHIPKIFADYDGKSPTVIYNKHVIKNINDVIGHYDRHNKIVWEKSWWQFTTWERVDCPTPNTINHNNIDLTIGNRLIKTEEGKAKKNKIDEETGHKIITTMLTNIYNKAEKNLKNLNVLKPDFEHTSNELIVKMNNDAPKPPRKRNRGMTGDTKKELLELLKPNGDEYKLIANLRYRCK